MKLFNKLFIITWLITIALLPISIHMTQKQVLKSEITWGVTSIKLPTPIELTRLLPGDKVLLKELNQVDKSKMTFPTQTISRLLESDSQLGTFDLYNKEVRIDEVDNWDHTYPVATITPNGHTVWLESEVIAEITFLKKVKHRSVVRNL